MKQAIIMYMISVCNCKSNHDHENAHQKALSLLLERDKGDYNNLHVHMLIGTNTDMTYQEVKYGMGNVSVGDYQPIYDSEAVCKYVTKHIGKDVDYDIVFKS